MIKIEVLKMPTNYILFLEIQTLAYIHTVHFRDLDRLNLNGGFILGTTTTTPSLFESWTKVTQKQLTCVFYHGSVEIPHKYKLIRLVQTFLFFKHQSGVNWTNNIPLKSFRAQALGIFCYFKFLSNPSWWFS